MAASQTRQPAPLRRNGNVSRPASGAQNPRLHQGRIARPRGPTMLSPAVKSRGLRSTVARRLARAWQATAPTHGTWQAPMVASPASDRLTRRLLLRSGDTPFRLRLLFGSIPRTLRCAKPPRQANTPGQRITSPGYGNARKLAGLRCGLVMRWPPDVCLASGRAGQLVLPPSLLSLPVQKPEDRGPAPHKGNRCWTCTPRRESGQLLLRLRCSCLRVWASAELTALTAAPSVSPTSGRPCSALGLTACPAAHKPRPGAAHYRPEVGTARPPRPNTNRARQLQLRFVRGCHEGCFRLQPQELLSAVPPRCRIPLAREPSAHGSPPPHRKSGCRRRNSARPSAARCTEDNSVLCPETSPRLSRSLLAAGCPDPAPPPTTQCARQSLRHPSRQPLSPLV